MTASGNRVSIKRTYEPADDKDGLRVLVDRLWPRGLSRAALAMDPWYPEAAPSSQLRKWFGHDPDHWRDFVIGYREEIRQAPDKIARLRAAMQSQHVTLLYAARDTVHNHARVLADVLMETAKNE